MSLLTRNRGPVVASVIALSFLALSSGARPARAEDDTITVESLLRRMTDTRWLAETPSAEERSVQFSSYDRATRLQGGKIIHPFANGDRGHYLRVEGEGDRRERVNKCVETLQEALHQLWRNLRLGQHLFQSRFVAPLHGRLPSKMAPSRKGMMQNMFGAYKAGIQ